jgi:hypothetical protein
VGADSSGARTAANTAKVFSEVYLKAVDRFE